MNVTNVMNVTRDERASREIKIRKSCKTQMKVLSLRQGRNITAAALEFFAFVRSGLPGALYPGSTNQREDYGREQGLSILRG